MSHVFVAMSGGVDSSVAAVLLQQAGYQISGINLRMFAPGDLACSEEGSCTSRSDADDAAQVAQRLGMPFHVFDASEPFRSSVIRYFVEEYRQGRTPNPCAECNRTIKFGTMLQRVLAMGGDCMATGHYARVEHDPASGRFLLKRGKDRSKDQSYFLYALTQEQLSRTLFPLGGLEKSEVRKIAEEHALINARKHDSQDICFVPDGKYAAFIEQTTGMVSPPGPFVDQDHQVLGQHKGIIRYTLGQHKGLGLSTETPLYVLEKDVFTNTIRLGPDSALWRDTLTAAQVNWISIPELTRPMEVSVKTRYSQREALATVEPLPGGQIRVRFREPQRALTPGQAVVLYDGELVVGGGTIL